MLLSDFVKAFLVGSADSCNLILTDTQQLKYSKRAFFSFFFLHIFWMSSGFYSMLNRRGVVAAANLFADDDDLCDPGGNTLHYYKRCLIALLSLLSSKINLLILSCRSFCDNFMLANNKVYHLFRKIRRVPNGRVLASFFALIAKFYQDLQI